MRLLRRIIPLERSLIRRFCTNTEANTTVTEPERSFFRNNYKWIIGASLVIFPGIFYGLLKYDENFRGFLERYFPDQILYLREVINFQRDDLEGLLASHRVNEFKKKVFNVSIELEEGRKVELENIPGNLPESELLRMIFAANGNRTHKIQIVDMKFEPIEKQQFESQPDEREQKILQLIEKSKTEKNDINPAKILGDDININDIVNGDDLANNQNQKESMNVELYRASSVGSIWSLKKLPNSVSDVPKWRGVHGDVFAPQNMGEDGDVSEETFLASIDQLNIKEKKTMDLMKNSFLEYDTAMIEIEAIKKRRKEVKQELNDFQKKQKAKKK